MSLVLVPYGYSSVAVSSDFLFRKRLKQRKKHAP